MMYGASFEGGSTTRTQSGSTVDTALRLKVRGLEKKMAKLELKNQVLWELVRDALKITDADLRARMKEIDLRDGIEDGAITTVPLQCPQCNRVSSSQHWKCMYCGMDFEEGCY